MNGIVEVLPNLSFKMLLANYVNKKYRLPNNHTMAHLLPHPSGVIHTTVNHAEVLGLRDKMYGDRNEQETPEVFTSVNEEIPKGPQTITESTQQEFVDHTNDSQKDTLSELDMEHLTNDYLRRLLTVRRKYLSL